MSDLYRRYYPVLDHGFIALVDHMGGDADIEQAARVSFGATMARKESDTRHLLRYMMRHHHTSPSEMGELKFHVGLPIFVQQQWLRHRTASLNQESHRYTEPTAMSFYRPEEWREQSTTNKQGSQEGMDPSLQHNCDQEVDAAAGHAENAYVALLENGAARELARIALPASTYTQMYWKVDLKNLLGFMSLRCDEHAQWEIRQYANIIAGIVRELFPLTFEAWFDYYWGSETFSRPEMELLLHMLWHGTKTTSEDGAPLIEDIPMPLIDALSEREQREFNKKTSIPRTVEGKSFILPTKSMTQKEMEAAWRRL